MLLLNSACLKDWKMWGMTLFRYELPKQGNEETLGSKYRKAMLWASQAQPFTLARRLPHTLKPITSMNEPTDWNFTTSRYALFYMEDHRNFLGMFLQCLLWTTKSNRVSSLVLGVLKKILICSLTWLPLDPKYYYVSLRTIIFSIFSSTKRFTVPSVRYWLPSCRPSSNVCFIYVILGLAKFFPRELTNLAPCYQGWCHALSEHFTPAHILLLSYFAH